VSEQPRSRRAEPPGPAHTVTVRLVAHPSPTLLPRLSDAVAEAGAIVVGVDLVDVGAGGATVDLTLQGRDEAHVSEVVDALGSLDGCRVRRVSDRTFLAHLGGKIEVVSKRPVKTRQDLALAYTPGVGRISEAIPTAPQDPCTQKKKTKQ
jgi:malate dehydrogenase (oxaloacetate-decarboxylating)